MNIAINKYAKRDYEILNEIEAGIKLSGTEVKSTKAGRVDMKGSFASIEKGEVWLKNLYIAPYSHAAKQERTYEPRQSRKMLLNKKEIFSLNNDLAGKSISLVPMRIYNKKGLIKVILGVGKGRKKYDKREVIKKRDFERRKLQSMHFKT